MKTTVSLKSSFKRLTIAALIWLGWLLPICVPGQTATSAATENQTQTPAIFRLNGTLLGVDGRPAAGTTVYLVGVDRMNMVNIKTARQWSHYHATTDAQG